MNLPKNLELEAIDAVESPERGMWLQRRLKGLGGTDIGRITGHSTFGNAYDVYCEKRELTPPFEPNLNMKSGNALEPIIAEEYAKATNWKVFNVDLGDLPVFPSASSGLPRFIFADPDRIVAVDDNGWRNLLECKSVHSSRRKDWGDEWSDGVPMGYLIQGQWYMGILELETCDYGVLFGKSDFQIFRTQFNPEIFGALVLQARDFWEAYVIPEIAPPVGGSDSNKDLLAQMYPVDTGGEKEASEKILDTVAILRQAKGQLAEANYYKQTLENEIKQFIGDDSVLVDQDGKPLVTWKKSKDSQPVNLKALVASLELPEETVAPFRELKEGSRRLLVK